VTQKMAIHIPSTSLSRSDENVRLVIEAQCSRCGPISISESTGFEHIDAALAHTAQTGHVVVLNGTVDRLDLEGRESFL
jgi:hypothetical protein